MYYLQIMTKNICGYIVLWTFVLITAGLIIGLAMMTRYAYLEPQSHYQEAQCYPSNCTSVPDTCCTARSYCDACYRVSLQITFSTNTTNCTKYTDGVVAAHDFCSWTSMTCFYDDRDTCETLRLWRAYNVEAADLGIALLAIFLALALVIWIFLFGVCLSQISRENNHGNSKNSNNSPKVSKIFPNENKEIHDHDREDIQLDAVTSSNDTDIK